MAMPDAVNFCSKLKEHLASTQGEERVRESHGASELMASLDMYTPASANFATLTFTRETDTDSKDDQAAL